MSALEECERKAGAQYGLITRTQALAKGLSESTLQRRLSSGKWRVLLPTVYQALPVPTSQERDQLAAVLWAGPGSAASHRGAGGVVWRFRGVPDDVVEITTPGLARGSGIIVHRHPLPADQIVVRHSVPVTDPTRTLIDLAAVLSYGTLEIALDDALRRRLTHVPLLSTRLSVMPHNRKGLPRLHALVQQRIAKAPVESPLESQVLAFLRRHGLNPPCHQHEIRCADGRVLRLDFAWPSEKVGIEVESYAWHSDRESWERDMWRHDLFVHEGYRVVRLTRNPMNIQGAEVISMLRVWLSRR